MSTGTWKNRAYIRRRKKEYLSLFIVRFLKASIAFNSIYRDYFNYENIGKDIEGSGLSDRMSNLCEQLIYDIKKKSDFLFRNRENECNSDIPSKYNNLKKMATFSGNISDRNNKIKELFSELYRAFFNQSIDSNINRIFNKLMVLKEHFYELEFYKTQYNLEHMYINKTLSLLKELGHELNKSESNELNHILELEKISQNILYDTKTHAKQLLNRCKSLFKETSGILLYIIQDSGCNEVLVLNMLRENELILKTYGDGASERIFSRMYNELGIPGNSGLEKAINYLKNNCDNTSGFSGF